MSAPSTDHISTVSIPALRGDGYGNYRIHLVGNSGAGKSTLGAELARLLGAELISLDQVLWQPGWVVTPLPEFRAKVLAAIGQNKTWIVDGNYHTRLGTMVDDEATDVIWLDPPLVLYFPRLFLRTVLRLLRIVPPCSPGCGESFRDVCSSNGILWWCLSQHWKVRKRQSEAYRTDNVWIGGKRRRIGGWGGELKSWRSEVEEMLTVGNVE
ncbi:hypothetical protein QCA50_003772 [Cerrena zonata]|uniref:Adenylate kinase n=1 Tax=Cerrena zonata TaxID=2478898 RepID=A0AAW0GF86_9APHY